MRKRKNNKFIDYIIEDVKQKDTYFVNFMNNKDKQKMSYGIRNRIIIKMKTLADCKLYDLRQRNITKLLRI